MKYVSLLFFSLALVMWSVGTQARDIKEMSQFIKQPLQIKAGLSKRMDVVFPHTAHRGINCLQCHHEIGPDGRYVACTECHSKPGPRERDPLSMFMAFHAKESDRSCVGCHKQMLNKIPAKYEAKFKGCRPCHMSNGSREALKAATE